MEDSRRKIRTAEGNRRKIGLRQEEGTWMHLEFDSHSSNEEFARVTVAVFMSRMDPTLEELEDVKTAVSEAVTNAVIHGYGERTGIIYIEAQIKDGELVISVRDEGKGIADLEKAMEPMYTTDTTGERSGMGFSFMEAFMDEVEVESEEGCGTCVTMRKRIGKERVDQNAKTADREKTVKEDWKHPGTESFYG